MFQFQTHQTHSLAVVGDYPTLVYPLQLINPTFKVDMIHVQYYANLHQLDPTRLYAKLRCMWMNPEDPVRHQEHRSQDLAGNKTVYAEVNGDFARFNFDTLSFRLNTGGYYYFEVDVWMRRGNVEDSQPGGQDFHIDFTDEMINRPIFVERVLHMEPGLV